MPEEVTFTNGNSTKFVYSAEGEKLRAVHTTGGTTTQVDYCGNIVYEAGVQKYLLNQEGYYDLAAGGYHYYLKDHLGNNRVVISHSGAVEQTTHYYPYGVWWEMHDHRKNSNHNNAEWEYFLKDGKTKEEIMEKAKEMARKYGYELNIKE